MTYSVVTAEHSKDAVSAIRPKHYIMWRGRDASRSKHKITSVKVQHDATLYPVSCFWMCADLIVLMMTIIYVKSSRLSFFTTASRVFLVPERDGPSMPTRGFGPTIAAIFAVLAGIGTLDRRIFVALEVTDVGRLNSNGANDRESDPLDGIKKRHQIELDVVQPCEMTAARRTALARRDGRVVALVLSKNISLQCHCQSSREVLVVS